MDPDHNTESNSDTTAASVHRMKCLVPSVVDVAANESILQLVYEEEPNFATEFQAILDDFCVLLELRYLVSRHRDISACIVSNNEECVSFEGLERGVLVKSIANELKQLASEVQTALGGQFGLSA